MELGLWLLFGLTVTSAAGKRAERRASPGGSSHKRTLEGEWGDSGKGALREHSLLPGLATSWGAEAGRPDYCGGSGGCSPRADWRPAAWASLVNFS